MTASSKVDHIRRVISQIHPFREWLVLDEFPLEGGRRTTGTPKIDVLAIKTLRSGRGLPLTREAYEIKTSRQDFQYELRHPEKRRKAYSVCDYYSFVVPEGLIEEDEVPPECGLIWVPSAVPVSLVVKMPRKLESDPP